MDSIMIKFQGKCIWKNCKDAIYGIYKPTTMIYCTLDDYNTNFYPAYGQKSLGDFLKDHRDKVLGTSSYLKFATTLDDDFPTIAQQYAFGHIFSALRWKFSLLFSLIYLIYFKITYILLTARGFENHSKNGVGVWYLRLETHLCSWSIMSNP